MLRISLFPAFIAPRRPPRRSTIRLGCQLSAYLPNGEHFLRMRSTVAPLFSQPYKTLFPQLLSFDILTKPRGYTPSALQENAIFAALTSSTSSVSYSYAHFCTAQKFKSPDFILLRTLSQKHRGGGYPSSRKNTGNGCGSALGRPGTAWRTARCKRSQQFCAARHRRTRLALSRNSPVEIDVVTRKKWYSAESARPAALKRQSEGVLP